MWEEFKRWVREKWKRFLEIEPDQKKIWVRALRTTKLEGLKDAFKPGMHIIKRICWVCCFSFFAIQSMLLTIESVNQAYKHPVQNGLDDLVKIEDTFCPGMTLCDKNVLNGTLVGAILQANKKISKTGEAKFGNITWNEEEFDKLVYVTDHICDSGHSVMASLNVTVHHSTDIRSMADRIVRRNATTIEDNPDDPVYTEKILPLIRKGLMNCTDAILACVWSGSFESGCKDWFVPSQTDIGTCCTFNKIPDQLLKKYKGQNSLHSILHKYDSNIPDVEKWRKFVIDQHPFVGRGGTAQDYDDMNDVPKRQTVSGPKYGMTLILKHEKRERNVQQSCSVYDGDGFVFAAHSPLEEPEMRSQGVMIQPDREVFLRIDPIITVADGSVKGLSISDRQCYFQDENPLHLFSAYTQGNCRKECVILRIKNRCKCLPMSMSKGNKETICSVVNRQCVQQIYYELVKVGYGKFCSTKCYPPCNEMNFKTRVVSTSYIRPKYLNGLNIAHDQPISILHSYIDSQMIERRLRTLQTSRADLVGTIGGIWGLNLGISIMRTMNILSGIGMFLYPFLRSIYIIGGIIEAIVNFFDVKPQDSNTDGNILIVVPRSDIDVDELRDEQAGTGNDVVDLREMEPVRPSTARAISRPGTAASITPVGGGGQSVSVEHLITSPEEVYQGEEIAGPSRRPSRPRTAWLEMLDPETDVFVILKKHGMKTRSQTRSEVDEDGHTFTYVSYTILEHLV